MNPIDQLLPLGLTADALLAYAVGAVTFVSVLATWRALVERDPRAARTRTVARYRQDLQASSVGAARRRTQRQPALLVRLGQGLRLAQAAQAEKLRGRLLQAGLRSRDAVAGFLAAKASLPLAFTVLGAALIYGLGVTPLGPEFRPLMLGGLVLFGFMAPDIFIANLASKRRQALQKALPDGLDLLVICAEAGLSLDAALNRVAEEVGASSPELADELALTAVELNFLPDRRHALVNFGKRCDLPAIRGVVNTLVQTERYGTPLSQSLRVLSAEFREQRMLRAEEKAARLPATLTVPMIIFILPTLFIVLIGPAMIDVYDKLIKS